MHKQEANKWNKKKWGTTARYQSIFMTIWTHREIHRNTLCFLWSSPLVVAAGVAGVIVRGVCCRYYSSNNNGDDSKYTENHSAYSAANGDTEMGFGSLDVSIGAICCSLYGVDISTLTKHQAIQMVWITYESWWKREKQNKDKQSGQSKNKTEQPQWRSILKEINFDSLGYIICEELFILLNHELQISYFYVNTVNSLYIFLYSALFSFLFLFHFFYI